MKIKENVTIYQCDHCNKKLFRQHAMVNHEKKCTQNPKNIRACFDCAVCDQVVVKFEPEPQTYNNNDELRKSHSYHCAVKNIFMYPPKMEHSNNGLPSYVEHSGNEISQEKMPLKCDLKKSMQDDVEKFFNQIK